MKTIIKPKKRAIKRRRVVKRVKLAVTAPLSAEEFRRQLHIDLADEIRAAQESFKKNHGHLLRTPTPAEAKTRSVRVRAMFAQWEEEERKNPCSREESDNYDRMLERMAAERAGDYSHLTIQR